MPLMNKIMKKYEQEAQKKIAEAQKQKKEEIKDKYSGEDGAEILHDPNSESEGEEVIETDSNGGTNIENESKRLIQEQQDTEPETSNDGVVDLHEGLKKANEQLCKLEENSEILKKIDRLEEENRKLKEKIKELEEKEPAMEEATESFY